MEKTFRTKEETVKYFKELSFHFEMLAHRDNNEAAKGKAEAYWMASFELENNMK